MRILLVSGSLPPMKCGVGDYTASLAKALGRRKDTSVAVLTDVAATPIPSDFDFEVFPITDGWRMADVIRITRAVHRWRPDLIHFQYPSQGYGRTYLPWLLPALFTVMKLPVVQTWHEYHMETCRRNLLNALLSCGLIAVRPNYEAAMPNWYRWLNRRKRFGFIPNSSAIPRMRLSEKEKFSIRSQFASPPTRLVVYFGFAYPHKRLELLFEIADPVHDYLVLICDLNAEDEYHKAILDRIHQQPWRDRVRVTGFLPSEEVGRILSAADAVVLPFRDGGGMWNTSIHAAVTQGTFVLTTAGEKGGYHCASNVYYARPDDVAEMASALQIHISNKRPETGGDQVSEWEAIAEEHMAFYASMFENSK
jgi:glycosyltransferase involved in cell wall biosynthesis